MAPPRYIYQRRGGPLLSWAGGPPSQTRGADAKSLGSLSDDSGDVFDGNPMGLPRPGSPEFLSNYEVLPSSNPPIKQRGVGDYSLSILSGTAAVVSVAGGAAATYHGYKRTRSVKWAILWGLLGSTFPIVTNGVAVAQGFGKPKNGG